MKTRIMPYLNSRLSSKDLETEETYLRLFSWREERGEVTETVVKADMDRFLERNQERALFDLPPRPAE